MGNLLRGLAVLGLCLLLAACGDDDVAAGDGGRADGAMGRDSGSPPPRDAASPDDGGTTPVDAGPPVDAGEPTLDCTLAWSSGFESSFPGEWLDYDNGSWSPDGTLPSGRVSAWTIIDSADGPVFAGDHSYRGWITGAAGESHRAYPVVHTDIPTPVVNTFMVYLEADYDSMGSSEWIHFGTWGNGHPDQWALHTMSVRDRHLEFAHVDPFAGEYIGPTPRPDFPLGRWVRLTVYMHYRDGNGEVWVWEDGEAMLRADIPDLSAHPGRNLQRAHWGMYASAETNQGVQYNDEIRVWTLPAPLTDMTAEPDCYLE